jgi:hypothetical protein
LAGNGKHNWYFPDSFIGTIEETTSFQQNSVLAKAYQGIGVFVAATTGDYPIPKETKSKSTTTTTTTESATTRYELFLKEMKSINNADDIAYLTSIIPHWKTQQRKQSLSTTAARTEEEPEGEESLGEQENRNIIRPNNNDESDEKKLSGNHLGPSGPTGPSGLGGFGSRFTETFKQSVPHLTDEHFLDPVWHESAAYFYDATMLMGLAACQLIHGSSDSSMAFTGKQQFDIMTSTSFQGVTGDVVLNPKTGTR